MKLIIQLSYLVVLITGCLSAQAQQTPNFTHYMNNTLVVNPGYAGSREALTVTTLHRSQWVDFKGAPVTQTLTLHAPIYNDHFGIGLSILNDKIRPTNNTSVTAAFAYKMKLSEKAKLALGLSAGMNLLQANLSSAELDNQNDPSFQTDVNNKVTPNVGFGAYYSREKFYAGISTPNLIQNTTYVVSKNSNDILINKQQRHFFVIAGTIIKLSEKVDLKPTTLLKVTASAPVQADITASFLVMKKLLVGAMYRSGDSFGALIGFDFTSQLHAGYSYDWSYGLKTGTSSNGSHELIFRYDFIFLSSQQARTARNF